MITFQPFRDEPRAGRACRNVVILLVAERLDLVRARLDRRRLDVRAGIGVVRLHQADVIEEELVAARSAELALFEKDAYLRSGAVVVIGYHLDDHRHLVRRVALEVDMLQRHLLIADARALVDRALDRIARDAHLLRLLHRGEKARVAGGIGSALLGGDRDFLEILSSGLRFSQRGDFTFGEQPLTTHESAYRLRPPQDKAALRPVMLARGGGRGKVALPHSPRTGDIRAVAQLGRALRSGRRGPGFKSLQPDQ